ncbi:MAG: hypothetical protein FWE03_01615 [Firmicutes bacterium]|nr:hypothetical protein [Bacillota bacterium]
MEKYSLAQFNVVDKSIAQRAIIISELFFDGRVKIDYLDGSLCEDILSAKKCVKMMKSSNEIIKLDAGNSATTLRLLVGAAVGLRREIEISGDESLNKRCMKGLINALKHMNASVFGIEKTDKILPPIRVKQSDNLKAIEFNNEKLSAQIKSAVLLAGFNLDKKTIVYERVHTRNHTELMLEYLNSFCKNSEIDLKIPFDISAAAFIIALAILKQGAMLKISSLGINPTRTGYIEALKNAGFNINIIENGLYGLEKVGSIYVKYDANISLSPFNLDGDDIARVIDEVPILCMVASFIKGESVFKNLGALKNKETNRINGIFYMLKSFGVDIKMIGDTLKINGGEFKETKKPVIKSKDHRIIMAAFIMGKLLKGCDIMYPECVSVSYPNFFEDVKYI